MRHVNLRSESTSCIYFLQQLLNKDPRKRPLANQIMRHAWIAGAPNLRRSRSKLFNTQRTLRRLKDLNKGDLKPGMTMREVRMLVLHRGWHTLIGLVPWKTEPEHGIQCIWT